MPVEGTDCMVYEPKPFDSTMYSHKFKSAGLRYEIVVSVDKGNIMWVYGPFKAVDWSDRKIFNFMLKNLL